MNNGEIWKKIDKDWETTDTSECGDTLTEDEGGSPQAECDETLCPKHHEIYREEVAKAFRADALGGKEPTCDKCEKQIQTDHRVIELYLSRKQQKKIVYHGNCAVLVYSEMNPQRDNKIRADTAKEIFKEVLEQLELHQSHCDSCRQDNIEMSISIIENIKKKWGIE